MWYGIGTYRLLQSRRYPTTVKDSRKYAGNYRHGRCGNTLLRIYINIKHLNIDHIIMLSRR